MIEKFLLDALLDDTFKRKIESVSRNCLRSTSERNKCTKCIEICPEKAIEEVRNGIVVDSILCGGCNLCVSSCYSRTFSAAKRPYINSLNKIVDGQSSNWRCKKTAEKEDINFGCLRTIDPRYLMALGFADLPHTVNLDFSQCEGCEYENLALDISALISYIKERGNLEHFDFSQGKTKQEEVVLSRRDFLGSIFKDSQNLTKSALKETSKSLGFDLESEENLDALIKILIKKGLSKNRDTSWMEEYIFDLCVDDSCTFCYECVSYCPTKALRIENKKDTMTLIVDSELCNFCNRCMEKCRYNSISKKQFTEMKESVLLHRQKTKCKGCLIATPSLNEEGYCVTCEIRNKNRK